MKVVVPSEPGKISFCDELGTIFKTKLLLPLCGPLLWTKQSEVQLGDEIGVFDAEELDFSLVILDVKVECSLGFHTNLATDSFEEHSIHRMQVGEEVLVFGHGGH